MRCAVVLLAVMAVVAVVCAMSIPQADVHMKGLALPGVQWGVHNSYQRSQPSLVEQYRRGVRLFEIDAYWWLGNTWLVAHIPIFFLGSSGYVRTVEEAACMLRQLGSDCTLFLDVKAPLWPTCTDKAVGVLRRQLAACADDGPLQVLVDVSCYAYDNVACARKLMSARLPNTTLLFRGHSFWWMSAKRPGNASIGHPCGPFQEPANYSLRDVPTLVECGHDMSVATCYNTTQAVAANVTWMQVRSV